MELDSLSVRELPAVVQAIDEVVFRSSLAALSTAILQAEQTPALPREAEAAEIVELKAGEMR